MPQTETPPIETDEQLKQVLETLLFITDRPLGCDAIAKVTGVKDEARIGALVREIRQDLETRGSPLQVLEVAEGFQMATRTGHAPFVRRLFADKMTMRLSTAAHETLSIVAYRQPITRAEIEEVRGVEVIAALETLLEKRLVRVVGRKETVGRPLMYGTTPDFLRHFGLRSLEDLPPLESFTPEILPSPAGEVVLETAAAEVPAEAEPQPEPEPEPQA
jgi:segregation and condensation protein B